jgi:hypothetical protein
MVDSKRSKLTAPGGRSMATILYVGTDGTRDGQLLLGRHVEAARAARGSSPGRARATRETFGALRDCFRLR